LLFAVTFVVLIWIDVMSAVAPEHPETSARR
jgi:hypothetical protein